MKNSNNDERSLVNIAM